MTDTEREHRWFEEGNETRNLGYARFQEETGLGKIDLAACEKLDEIDSLARKYLQSDEVKEQISKCAKLLSKKHRWGRI